MSAVEQQTARRLSPQHVRGLIALGVLLAIIAAIAGAVMLWSSIAAGNRAQEAELLAAFQEEIAADNATYIEQVNPDRVVWLISAQGLSNGLDLDRVTQEVRAFQSVNARFQAVTRGRAGDLKTKLARAGLGSSRQRRVIEAYEAGRSPGVATSAFLLRHELGEEVLSIADLLDRRRGAWRISGDELVFGTNADRTLYERAVDRQQEIQKSIPDPAG